MSSGGATAVDGDGGFFTLAATALCCYEYLITFDKEIQSVWRRHISVATMLFLFNRYAILALSLGSVIQVVPWGWQPRIDHSRVETCTVFVRFLDACLILVNIAYAVFAALRMFALCRKSKLFLALVMFLGLINPFAQIFLMYIETIGVNPTFQPIGLSWPSPLGRVNCYHFVTTSVLHQVLGKPPEYVLEYTIPALRLHAIVFEGVLIWLTWRKTAIRWSLQKSAIRTPFTTMLLRNGTLYFVIIAAASILNLVGIMILILNPNMMASSALIFLVIATLASLGPIVDTITSICMSRFILGLLAISSLDEISVSEGKPGQPEGGTLRFATIAESLSTDLVDVGRVDLNQDG